MTPHFSSLNSLQTQLMKACFYFYSLCFVGNHLLQAIEGDGICAKYVTNPSTNTSV